MPEEVSFAMHELAFAVLSSFAFLLLLFCLTALVLGTVQKVEEKHK